jgi:hypothetical protein
MLNFVFDTCAIYTTESDPQVLGVPLDIFAGKDLYIFVSTMQLTTRRRKKKKTRKKTRKTMFSFSEYEQAYAADASSQLDEMRDNVWTMFCIHLQEYHKRNNNIGHRT